MTTTVRLSKLDVELIIRGWYELTTGLKLKDEQISRDKEGNILIDSVAELNPNTELLFKAAGRLGGLNGAT
jgi:hypothetical protein